MPIEPEAKARKRKRSPIIPRLKKWTPVLVEWHDAVLHEGPQNSDSEFRIAIRYSVGHFVKRSDTGFTIAMEDDRNDEGDASDCDNASTIALGMIRAVTVLAPVSYPVTPAKA
jgi:hypothetical protein